MTTAPHQDGLPAKIAEAILFDLDGRKGLTDTLDDDVREEILSTHTKLIAELLAALPLPVQGEAPPPEGDAEILAARLASWAADDALMPDPHVRSTLRQAARALAARPMAQPATFDLTEARAIVVDAIRRMRAGHVACHDLTMKAEAFLEATHAAAKSDQLWDQTLQERDRYHEVADSLAQAIAKHLGADIGEHSNLNCPWEQALEALAAIEAEKAQPAPEPDDAQVKAAAIAAGLYPDDHEFSASELMHLAAFARLFAVGRADAQLEIDRLTELNKRLQQLVDDANKVAEIAQRRADAQLAEPTDTEMLDWLFRQDLDDLVLGLVQDSHHDGEYCVHGDNGGLGYGKTPRDAIHAAMLAARAEKGGT